jgi:hypothetical protein
MQHKERFKSDFKVLLAILNQKDNNKGVLDLNVHNVTHTSVDPL